jgi:hypothetical protein
MTTSTNNTANEPTVLTIGLSFDPIGRSLLLAGLSFEVLSRFFNFADGSWHAHVGGVAYDNLTLISSPRSLGELMSVEDFESYYISEHTRLFPFKKITSAALQEWGFKESWLEENEYEHGSPELDWGEAPRDPAFKILCIHDDYFISFYSEDLPALKQLAVFAVNECIFFLHQQRDRLLSSQSIEYLFKLLADTEGGEITADKKNSTLTYSYKVESQSWIKRLFCIRDVVKKEIPY